MQKIKKEGKQLTSSRQTQSMDTEKISCTDIWGMEGHSEYF